MNTCCKELHAAARDSFLHWKASGNPKAGQVYEKMKSCRAQFKVALRHCRAQKNQQASDALAMKLMNNDCKDFWKEVKKVSNTNIKMQATTIEGVTGSKEICNMWRDHFYALLNSSTDTSKQDVVMEKLSSINDGQDVNFTPLDVANAIRKLKNGKSSGLDNLSSEHYQKSHGKISVYLSIIFNCMILHGHVPERLMDTILISLVKDKKGNISECDNYRPIAITCVSSKVIELIILDKFEEYFETSSHQFGFKKGHATDKCIFVLKEIISYYGSLSSPVYACMLDSSKAFDRVNHFYLFDKLLIRQMPKLLVRLLYVWYRSQNFYVKWEKFLSEPFKVGNGVRQGGVLSPKLFNVFIDELSYRLSTTDVGCFMNGTSFNHMCYADDAVILAPTPGALQELITICNRFAIDNDMKYNVKKTVCMSFIPKMYGNLDLPLLYLDKNVLTWVPQHKYLGAIINSKCTDDEDINRQIRAIYTHGNVLVRNFSHCCDEVKIELFRTYCSILYICQLWHSYSKMSYQRIQVAYNNIFRMLLKVQRGCSISHAFVSCNLDGFKTIVQKAVWGFYRRVLASSNHLVQILTSSSFFTYASKTFKKWNEILYVTV